MDDRTMMELAIEQAGRVRTSTSPNPWVGAVVPLLAGPTAAAIDDLWRGSFADVRRVGEDLRIDLVPDDRSTAMSTFATPPPASKEAR